MDGRIPKALRAIACGAFLFLGAAELEAQQDSRGFIGTWRCEHANGTVRNLMADNWSYAYVIQLNDDGTFMAQGQYFAQVIGYPEPFMAQGRWRIAPDGMVAQGNTQQGLPFFSGGNLAGGSYISNGVSQAGQWALKCDRMG